MFFLMYDIRLEYSNGQQTCVQCSTVEQEEEVHWTSNKEISGELGWKIIQTRSIKTRLFLIIIKLYNSRRLSKLKRSRISENHKFSFTACGWFYLRFWAEKKWTKLRTAKVESWKITREKKSWFGHKTFIFNDTFYTMFCGCSRNEDERHSTLFKVNHRFRRRLFR